jgi:hypothetical protein
MTKLVVWSTIALNRRQFVARSLVAIFTASIAAIANVTPALAFSCATCCSGTCCNSSNCNGFACTSNVTYDCSLDFSHHSSTGCWTSSRGCPGTCCDCTCCTNHGTCIFCVCYN